MPDGLKAVLAWRFFIRGIHWDGRDANESAGDLFSGMSERDV